MAASLTNRRNSPRKNEAKSGTINRSFDNYGESDEVARDNDIRKRRKLSLVSKLILMRF